MRYLININEQKAKELLGRVYVDANTTLAQDIVITKSHNLAFDKIEFCSLDINEQEKKILIANGYTLSSDEKKKCTLFAGDYIKRQSNTRKLELLNVTGRDVKIGDLDTGRNDVLGLSFSNNFNFADANPGVLDNFNHGTMVTSVIKSLVGSHKGVVNDVDFYTIKVVDDAGGITITSFAAGVNQAITSGLDCLVMPLQIDDATVQSLINSLLDNNCIPFCSAGNASGGSVSTVVSPASKMNAVAVGAVKEDNSYHYTNLLGVTFVCGGYGQNVVNNAGGVQLAYGTSFSAPTAAGIFAGHKEISGLLDNKKVVQKMKNSCKKHEPSLFGYGILQA